ncbi:diguanylate cyclase [Spongiibacter taiwanensis]|uniref:GGDEF domain-containing protein n=1 Tax=Spongiibacter taiwanensis TaxID=1748242 RepID=UPI002034F9A2|nr:diguanylate cyclase [Spongiibacter taiwanensis]USA44650.1 diguanylate cyclase [Spongiibacter taiwanensis]
MLRHIMDTLCTESTGHVLIVDDDETVLTAFSAVLGQCQKISVARSGREALELLSPDIDLILLDYRLPDMDGLEVLRAIKQFRERTGVAVIMITADSDEVLECEALRLGAIDFLRKPFSSAVLQARVAVHLERRQCLKQILQMAQHDELTGSLSRRAFFLEAAREFSRAKRHGTGFSLLYFDLDKFKAINDNFGHSVGDRVLKSFAQTCMARKREHDLFGRIGGDEFVMLLTRTNLANARTVAEDICRLANKVSVAVDEGLVVQPCVSVGISAMRLSDTALEDVVHRADMSVFDGKSSAVSSENTVSRARTKGSNLH